MPYLNESKLDIEGLTANEGSIDKAIKSGSNYFSQRNIAQKALGRVPRIGLNIPYGAIQEYSSQKSNLQSYKIK